ncbi:hypothetical protein BIW11_04105 [Tropilaelaps mercedesae]|uniref:CCDC92/74 N-terminal domain-containing protein n=1 Tax=Tropilaelaps mercedesae TaxID=418985 RepID=A0A1V9XBD4_9ACAR|nr:hypothetical protein BIW11_04105 [Tropilaelaps mercedesae]
MQVTRASTLKCLLPATCTGLRTRNCKRNRHIRRRTLINYPDSAPKFGPHFGDALSAFYCGTCEANLRGGIEHIQLLLFHLWLVSHQLARLSGIQAAWLEIDLSVLNISTVTPSRSLPTAPLFSPIAVGVQGGGFKIATGGPTSSAYKDVPRVSIETFEKSSDRSPTESQTETGVATCSQWNTESEGPNVAASRLTPLLASSATGSPERKAAGEDSYGGPATNRPRGGEQGRRIFRERFHTMTTIDDDSSSDEEQDEEARRIKENPLVFVKQASELLEDEVDEMASTDSESTSQEALVALQVKLHSAKNDLLFVQGYHKMTLRGLHREVERLQKSVRELQFALITQGLTLVDEETYQKRLRQLEASLNQWTMRCNYLSKQLTVANDTLVELNERVQLQEWEYDDMIRQRDRNIAILKRQLEMKSIEVEVLRQVTGPPPSLLDDRPPLKRAHSDVSRTSMDVGGHHTPPPVPRTPQHRRKVLRLPLLVTRMLTMSPHKKKTQPPSTGCGHQMSPRSR